MSQRCSGGFTPLEHWFSPCPWCQDSDVCVCVCVPISVINHVFSVIVMCAELSPGFSRPVPLLPSCICGSFQCVGNATIGLLILQEAWQRTSVYIVQEAQHLGW